MVTDVFFSPEAGGWRLYVAEAFWCPVMLRQHLDEQLEARCLRPFDPEELRAFMWSCDAPYEIRPSKAGGAQVVARARSAVVLTEWLHGMLTGEAK